MLSCMLCCAVLCCAQGYVPVLHGDMVLDETQNWSVLSGDQILSALCTLYRPTIAVFVTNVDGVLGAGGQVVKKISVHPETGAFELPPQLGGKRFVLCGCSCVGGRRCLCLCACFGGVFTGGGVDVSGGMINKLQACAALVQAVPQCRVSIVRAATPHCARALLGNTSGTDFVGTEIFVADEQPLS
jgi:isopentenyl phosphate kinase